MKYLLTTLFLKFFLCNFIFPVYVLYFLVSVHAPPSYFLMGTYTDAVTSVGALDLLGCQVLAEENIREAEGV